MTGNGADGHSVALAPSNAVVEHGDVLAAPDRMVPLHDHHISGFDEGPFQVVVGLLNHPSVALLATAALYFGNRT